MQSPIAPESEEEILVDTTPEMIVTPSSEDSVQATTIKVNRPSTNEDEEKASTESASESATQAEADASEEEKGEMPGLEANAIPFENPDTKPVLSVILIDNPQRPVSDETLENLPFALSFAIDATRDDAAAVAERYNEAGYEVLMLTNLPSGAEASDIEVSFEAYAHAMPKAVAVLDQGEKGFLRGASAATQIAGILSDRDLGLITPSKGLNSAQKAAKREGVASALIYRELDADGEDAAKISRSLDRAAFRAGQEGDVIVLGHTHPETFDALAQWAQEDRAENLVFGPVSAVLMGQ